MPPFYIQLLSRPLPRQFFFLVVLLGTCLCRAAPFSPKERSSAAIPLITVPAISTVNDAPTLTKGADLVVREDESASPVLQWATAVSAGPADEAWQSLSFLVTTDNQALFAVQPTIDALGTLTFSPARDAWGTATVTVVLRDNGGTENGGIDSSLPQTFTITVTPVNDAPSFTKGSDVTVLENAGIQVLEHWATTLSAGPANESSQILSFLVSNDNPALFSSQPAVGTDGQLGFTPTTGSFGQATLTLRLQDDGGVSDGGIHLSTDQTFLITVLPVNNAPSFTKGTNVNVLEDAGPQRFASWATGIAAGPPSESAQSLSFLVTTEQGTLFEVLPAIDPLGTLSFTPARNAYGTARVRVFLQDNGGTENGGVDQSSTEQFTLSILPVNDAPFLDTPREVALRASHPPYTLPLTGITPGPGERGQSLSIAAVSNNPSLLDITAAQYLQGSPTASLIFQPRSGQAGTATVTISVKDNGDTANGGLDTYATTFRVVVAEEASVLFIPTLFSPNADSHNDVFRVRGAGIASVELRLFTQTGVEVFRASDIRSVVETGWDGTCQGRPLPPGSYTWTLSGRLTDGRSLTAGGKMYGQVTLVR